MADEGNVEPRPGSAEGPGESTRPFEAVPRDADPDATVVTPPVGPGLDDTRLDGTPVPPPAGSVPPEPSAWSARAAVRPPGPAPAGAVEEWDEGGGGDPYQGRSWFTPVIIALVVAVLLALLGVGIWLIYRNSRGGPPAGPASSSAEASTASAPPSPTTAAPTTAAPSTAAPTTAAPTPAQIPVPPLTGATEADARQALQALGLKVTVSRVPSTQPPGTVLATQPGAGALVNQGDTVALVVAQAPPTPPTTKPASPSPSGSH